MNRFHTRWLSVLLLLLLLSVTAFAAQAQDGESPFDIPEIRPNNTVEGVFEGDIAARLYTFKASEGDIATITMRQASGSTLDPLLVLLGPFGEVLDSNDDGLDNLPLASQIEDFEIPYNGEYLILATDVNFLRRQPELDTDSAGSLEIVPLEYSLELRGVTAPPRDESDTPVFEPIDDEAVFEVELTPELPVFLAMIEGSEDEAMTISALSEEVDTLLMVFGPQGARFAVNDDIGSGNYSSELVDLRLPIDGAYLILVTAFDFAEAFVPGWENFGVIFVEVNFE